jgi:muconolactone delta-isomerase
MDGDRSRYVGPAVFMHPKDPIEYFTTSIDPEEYQQRAASELELLVQWKQEGKLLDFQAAATAAADPDWHGFLTFRMPDRQQMEALLQQLPLTNYLTFKITELALPPVKDSLLRQQHPERPN